MYALGNPNLLVLKPGDLTTPPKVASQGNVQGPGMLPLGPSPVREVTLAELRKLFDDKTKKLVVHYTVLPKKGCGPCDESTAVFEEFARKNVGKATFVGLANEYSEAAWSDPWYAANAQACGCYLHHVLRPEGSRARERPRIGGGAELDVAAGEVTPVRCTAGVRAPRSARSACAA